MVIYTCPKCGTDLDEYVLTTYPAQYMKKCRNCGWSHIDIDQISRVRFDPKKDNAVECKYVSRT